MADNFMQRDVLPKGNSMDLGKLEYNADTSLSDIAGSYQGIGKDFTSLAQAAANDVGNRQRALIGNDFGPVSPNMYAAYYQPTANDFASGTRLTGAEVALGEGLERGKQAAENRLQSAKNSYQQAADAYSNAKNAFANLRLAEVKSEMSPDGTDQFETLSIAGLEGADRTAVQRKYLQQYTDSLGVANWDDKQLRAAATAATKSKYAYNDNATKEEKDAYWASDDVSIEWTYNYVKNYLAQQSTERAQAFETTYVNTKNAINNVYDFANGFIEELDLPEVIDTLGKASVDIPNLSTGIEKLLGLANDIEKVDEGWIRENVSEEDQEELISAYRDMMKKKYDAGISSAYINEEGQKVKGARKPGTGATSASSKAKKDRDALKQELENEFAELVSKKLSKNAGVELQTQKIDDYLENMFGFDTSDLRNIANWKKENPDEYKSYTAQLAQVAAQTDAIEVADGERYYYVNGEYQQLPAGTPVFFVFEGALDENHQPSGDLKDFVDAWKDYYSADAETTTDEELSSKSDALNTAYQNYMKNVSMALQTAQMFNMNITPDIYRAISAMENPANSELTINGQSIKDFLVEFSKESNEEKYNDFISIIQKSHVNTDNYIEYSKSAGGAVAIEKEYGEGQSEGLDKIDRSMDDHLFGSYNQSRFANIPNEQALAYFLVLTRSMEKYNQGNTTGNINPKFVRDNKASYFATELASQGYGALVLADATASTAVKTIESVGKATLASLSGVFQGKSFIGELSKAFKENNPFEAEGLTGKSLKELFSPLFTTGDYQFEEGNLYDQTNMAIQRSRASREQVKSIINPLMYDLYYGDVNDFNKNKGIGAKWSSDSLNLDTVSHLALSLTAMTIVNKAEASAVELCGTAAKKLASSIVDPAVNAVKTAPKNASAIKTVSGIVDNADDATRVVDELMDGAKASTSVDDLYLAGKAVGVVEDADDVTNVLSDTARTTTKLDDIAEASERTVSEYAPTTSSSFLGSDEFFAKIVSTGEDLLTNKYINGVDKQLLNTLTKIATGPVDDTLEFFEEFAEKATAAIANSKAGNTLKTVGDFVTETGEKIAASKLYQATLGRKTVAIANISAATGLSAEKVAMLPNEAIMFLNKALKGMTDGSAGAVVDASLKAFLNTMSDTDFTALAQAVVERAVVNAKAGKKTFDMFDVYRSAAVAGWQKSGTAALTRSFVQDALTDPFKDFLRNVKNPQLDNEGNLKVQTVASYFTDPSNFVQNILYSTATFGLGRAFNTAGNWVSTNMYKKYINAIDATGVKDGRVIAGLLEKANKWADKAQMYSERAWKNGASYQQVLDNTTASNELLDKAAREIFTNKGYSFTLDGVPVEKLNTAEDWSKYVENNIAPAKDALRTLYNIMGTKSINNYFLYRKMLGEGIKDLGTQNGPVTRSVLRVLNNSLNDHYDEVMKGKGSIESKVTKMYKLMAKDAIKANSNGSYGITITNFEKSIKSYLNTLQTAMLEGLKDGTIDNVRLGYLPTSNLIFRGTAEDMYKSHQDPVSRGLFYDGGVIAFGAANPAERRKAITMDAVLDAMDKGEKTLKITNDAGDVVEEVLLDYDGLNLLDSLNVYSNNYNVHKYIDPILGNNRSTPGEAAMNLGYAFLNNKELIAEVYNKDLKFANDKFTGYDYKNESGELVHVKGWNEKALDIAAEKYNLTKKELAGLKKNGSVNYVIGGDNEARIKELNVNISKETDALNKAIDTLKTTDLPRGVYPTIAKHFNYESAEVAEQKFNNARVLAGNMLKAYVSGDLSADSVGRTFTYSFNYNGENLKKDMLVDDIMISMLDSAAKNPNSFNSDLAVYVLSRDEITTPYKSRTKIDDGYKYDYAKGYKSSFDVETESVKRKVTPLMKFNTKAVDAQFGANDGKLKFGKYTYNVANIMSKTYGVEGITSTTAKAQKKLENFTEALIKDALGDNAFSDRYASMLVSNARRMMLNDKNYPDGFNADQWFDTVINLAGDLDLVKQYQQDIAPKIKGIENDRATGTLRYDLENKIIGVLAGEYDGSLPKGKTKYEVAKELQDFEELLTMAARSSERYTTEKALKTVTDDEGNETTIADYAISESNLESNRDLSDLDSTTDAFKRRLTNVKTVLDNMYDKNSIYHLGTMSDLHNTRINLETTNKSIYDDLGKQAKALYDSKANAEYNKLVDRKRVEIVNRAKYDPKKDSLAPYLEALGVTAPGTGVSLQGSSSYGYNAENYVAAKSYKEGTSEWSSEASRMRLEAGTVGGYTQQLIRGIEALQGFSGGDRAYSELLSKAKKNFAAVPDNLKAEDGLVLDNLENSILSALSTARNDAKAVVVYNMDATRRELASVEKSVAAFDRIFKVKDGETPLTLEEKNLLLEHCEEIAQNKKFVENIDTGKLNFSGADKARNAAIKDIEARQQEVLNLVSRFEDPRKLLENASSVLPEVIKDEIALPALREEVRNYSSQYVTAAEMSGKTPIVPIMYSKFATTDKIGNTYIFGDAQVSAGGQKYTIISNYGTAAAEGLESGSITLSVRNEAGKVVSLDRMLKTSEHSEEFVKGFNEQFGDNLQLVTGAELDRLEETRTLVQQYDKYGDYYLVDKTNFLEQTYDKDDATVTAINRKVTVDEKANIALQRYAADTKDYNPTRSMSEAHSKYDYAKKQLDSFTKELADVKAKSDTANITIDGILKKNLDYEDKRKYKADKAKLENVKNASHDDFYNGGSFFIDASGKTPAGYTTLDNIIGAVGYMDKDKVQDILDGKLKLSEDDIKAEIRKQRRAQKNINKNKKLTVGEEASLAFDVESQAMTLSNLFAFAEQVKRTAGVKDLKAGDIVIDKDYANLLVRVSRDSMVVDKSLSGKLRNIMFEVTDWNKFIQQNQLAGGASWVNALSLAQLRGAVLSDPRACAEYIKLCSDFKDDANVTLFATNNMERLTDFAIRTNDMSILTDFKTVAGHRPGLDDGNVLTNTAQKVLDASKHAGAYESKYEFAKDMINSSTDALFGDATFQRMLPVLRAKMLIQNYDNAVRAIQKKFPDISSEALNDMAIKFSYSRVEAFFNADKTITLDYDKMWKKYNTDKSDEIVAQVQGSKSEVTILDMAKNCFFALGYKTRIFTPVLEGAADIPSSIRRKYALRGTHSINDSNADALISLLGTDFMRQGSRNQIKSLVFLALGAFITSKALGLATSWDDLNFIDEGAVDENGNPLYKVPEILTKTQTIGQIWLPNAYDSRKGTKLGESIGGFYVDPNKKMYSIDTMSSIFSAHNSVWKTIDRIVSPQSYYSAPQRGIGLLSQNLGVNPQGINNILNNRVFKAVGDELIGSNLLSPYKAAYEVLVDSSYYGNNIWEKRYLSDGSENPNYDPMRNIVASFNHILGFDKYNDYVKGKGTNGYVAQDQIGSVGGSGIFQHEYVTALINLFDDDPLSAVIEGGELPIKSKNLSSQARTDFNIRVKNVVAQYMAEYRNNSEGKKAEEKDKLYTDTVKKCADLVSAWSEKWSFVLGQNQELVPYTTRAMMCMLAGEYDDRLDYIQNTYWKASDIAQITSSAPSDYWLDDEDYEEWIKAGKTTEEYAAEKNKRTNAYYEALDAEYKARKALNEAGIDNEYLAGLSTADMKAEQRAVNKEVFYGVKKTLESKVGEFDSYKEMKAYYEAQIAAATTTNQKAKLAKQYNTYVTDALAPYVEKYGAAIVADGYYNGDYLSNWLSEYVIIPADKNYGGKSPHANYVKDLFHVGYRDSSALPSDSEVIEGYSQAKKQLVKGYNASASAMLDKLINAIKSGRVYASDTDYSKIVRMKALVSVRSL